MVQPRRTPHSQTLRTARRTEDDEVERMEEEVADVYRPEEALRRNLFEERGEALKYDIIRD